MIRYTPNMIRVIDLRNKILGTINGKIKLFNKTSGATNKILTKILITVG
jgi:hypothetical protein